MIISGLLFYGGCKITIGGSDKISEYLGQVFSEKGNYAFDAKFMSGIYEKPFMVANMSTDEIPSINEKSIPLGRHLDGYRIGFDLGASDRKVSAVVEGETVFSEEVPWDPRNQSDPA